MIFQIEVSDEANRNIQDAVDYYHSISDSVARKFIIDLEKCINHLELDPFLHQLRYRRTRIVLLKQFPYGVHFIIESSTIAILKVLHHKQFYR